MKTLIVYTYACRESAIEACKNNEGSVFLIEADFPFGHVIKQNMTIASYDTFLSPADYAHADKWIKDYWDRSLIDNEGRDLSEWNGTSLKPGIHGLMIHQIYRTIRELIVIRKALALLEPQCVHCGIGISVNPDLWERFAVEKGVEFKRLNASCEKEDSLLFAGCSANIAEFSSGDDGSVLRRLFARVNRYIYNNQKKVNDIVGKYVNRPEKLSIYIASRPEKEMLKLGLDKNEMAKNGIKVISSKNDSIDKLRPMGKSEENLKAEKVFTQRWASLKKQVLNYNWIYYDSICLWDFLESKYEETFRKELPRLAVESDISKVVLRKYRPSSLISKINYHGDSPVWFENAKKAKIPTIILQREQLIPGVNEGFPPIHADWVLTQGPSSDAFIQKVLSKNDIRTMQYGCSTREELQSIYIPKKVREKYILNESQIVLYADGHYCSTSLRESPIRLINGLKSIVDCAGKLPHLQFLIKIHPGGKKNHREQRDYFRRRLEVGGDKLPENLIWLPIESDMKEIFSLLPIVVSIYSTVGIEAMYANLPSVFLYPKEHGNELPDFEEPVPSAIVAHSDCELAAILKNISNDYEGWQNRLISGQKKYWQNLFSEFKSPADLIAKVIRGTASEKT